MAATACVAWVADSRFQPELVRQAQAHGKLPASCVLPEQYSQNLPAALDARLQPWSQAGLQPAFPVGTDLTADEPQIVNRRGDGKHTF